MLPPIVLPEPCLDELLEPADFEVAVEALASVERVRVSIPGFGEEGDEPPLYAA